jgi:hypothetical protein
MRGYRCACWRCPALPSPALPRPTDSATAGEARLLAAPRSRRSLTTLPSFPFLAPRPSLAPSWKESTALCEESRSAATLWARCVRSRAPPSRSRPPRPTPPRRRLRTLMPLSRPHSRCVGAHAGAWCMRLRSCWVMASLAALCCAVLRLPTGAAPCRPCTPTPGLGTANPADLLRPPPPIVRSASSRV